MPNQIVNVSFLKHPTTGDTFAYFPRVKYAYNGYRNDLKTCYSHVGQHSGCANEYTKNCVYLKPNEYDDLKQELESIGYTLIINPKNK